MKYRLYQMNIPKNPLNTEINSALQSYIAKHGQPPTILIEASSDLAERVDVPEGMNVVIRSIKIPKNMLLIGNPDEISLL